MPRAATKERLKKLKYYMSNPSTRDTAYLRVAEEYDTSVAALRMAASRAGMVSQFDSLRFSFSPRSEEALRQVCLKYARRGMPLTIHDFIELASRFKDFPKSEKISRHFVRDFIGRHGNILWSKPGKATSPKRSSDVMEQETDKFISDVDPLFEKNTINKSNLFVFDETVIGDSGVMLFCMGERRDSGGGNINAYRKRGKALGCFVPFSLCDGSTPFRVFITKEGSSGKDAASEPQPKPVAKVVPSPDIHRVYLSSKSGFVTIPLFKCILDEFSKWWKQHHEGLNCYLVCDNMRAHVNESVKEFANARGIHIIPIMRGSSHWFQVHDQLPFGTLKKNMSHKRNSFSRLSSLGPAEMKSFMKGIFMSVEEKALAPEIVLKSFADVGLYPWNPVTVRELCRKHCPPPSLLNTTPQLRKLERIMNSLSAEQEAEQNRLMELGKHMIPDSTEKEPLYHLRHGKTVSPQVNECLSRPAVSRRRIKSIKMQPPVKRPRRTQTAGKPH